MKMKETEMAEKIKELHNRIGNYAEWLTNTPTDSVTKFDCITILLETMEFLLQMRSDSLITASEPDGSWKDTVTKHFMIHNNSYMNNLALLYWQINKIRKERDLNA